MKLDVVDLILQDHEEMRRMIREVRDAPAERAGVVTLFTTFVTAHERAEESEVYPAARTEAEGADEVEHSQEEHLQADKLLRDLAEQEPGTSAYASTLDELLDAIEHHLEEEEADVLPTMREGLSDERRHELGEAFLAAREEHLGEQAPDMTKAQLAQQAENLGESVGGRTKAELIEDLEEQADE